MGILLKNMSNVEESKLKLNKVYENSKKLFGENHGITIRCMEELSKFQ